MRLACVFWVAALSASASQNYRSYFLTQLAAQRSHSFALPDAFVDNGHLHDAACAAGAEVRAFELTGNKEMAASAVARLRAIAAFLNKGEEASFFVPYPLTWTYRELDRAGLIDAELKAAMRSGVAKSFKARDTNEIHNQTLQRATGLALAAQTWPDLPQAKSWREYAETIYKMIARMEDVPENSTNYNSIDVVFTFLLADVTGHSELIRSRGIRAMYARYRDQVAPSGFIPPYGDAGSASQPFNPAWPSDNDWAMYVEGFERAAREYQDPTLAWAAQTVAAAGMAHEPLDHAYNDIIDLFYFSFAVPQREEKIAEPKIASAILTRSDSAGPAQQDKLILAPSRQPGAPFLLSDLYVRGPHAHENQHGAVAYFEYNNAPLITATGYNNREPDEASLVMMRPSDEPFPSVPGVYTANQWHEAMLPTSRLPVTDPKHPDQRTIDGLNVRIESQGVTAWVANFRLAGAKEQLLDAGNSAEGWMPKPTVEGEAIRWESPKGIQFHTKAVHAAFNCRDYPVITFRWKLSSNQQIARPIILRVVSGAVNTDYHVEAVQLQPTLDRARVDQHENGRRESDQYGVMEYSGWMTPDTTLRRQMVLTQAGVLIVRDRLVPGPLAKGMAAGPIWQMTSDRPVQQNGNWFYSSGGPMELLTWFGKTAENLVFGQQTNDIWSKKNQRTVFAKEVLQPGKPVYFVSVLAPQAPGADAARAAAGIEVRNEASGATVHVATPRDTVTVRLADNDIWSITR